MAIDSLLNKVLATGFAMMIFLSGSAAQAADEDRTKAQAYAGLPAVVPGQNLYKVNIQRGKHRTKYGTNAEYTLYLPEKTGDLPGGPYPMVVLIHGFLMTGREQSHNAVYLAQRGIAVFTPNISKLLWGDDKRMRNVSDALDHITWLTERTRSDGDELKGLLDMNRVAVGGNSSGGAVILEMLIQGQKAGIPIKAICSLDGVPWDRTWDRMPDIKPVSILSLRSEPSLCNYHARVLRYLARLSFPVDDVKIVNAHHCDAENPTTVGCMCVCGWTEDKYRLIYQLLLYHYLKDTLAAAPVGSPQQSFVQFVDLLAKEGKVIPDLKQTQQP